MTKYNFLGNGLELMDTRFISGDWDTIREGQYDVIIGADVTYNPEYHTKLGDLIERLLAPGGRVILAAKVVYIGNGGRIVDFLSLMTGKGFKYNTEQVSHSGVVRLIVTLFK